MENKKYAVIDMINDGDAFEDIFETEAEALENAEMQYEHMSNFDRKRRAFFAVMAGSLDDDGCFDLNAAEMIKCYIND